MKLSIKSSWIGGTIAFILATACCWLPLAILSIGGTAAMVGFGQGLEKFSSTFMLIGVVFLGVGFYQLYNRKTNTPVIQLISTITCPDCGHKTEETMPTNACQYFYECNKCHTVLKPLKGDCCVYCSYGSVACPPIQQDQSCC